MNLAETLHTMAVAVNARVDSFGAHAAVHDGQGWSKFHAQWGKRVAGTPPSEWTPQFTASAYKLMKRYRKQAQAYTGIEFESLPAPAVELSDRKTEPRSTGGKRSISFADDAFTIRSEYNRELVAAIRDLPGRKWTGTVNTVPLTSASALLPFAEKFKFSITPEAAKAIDENAGKSNRLIKINANGDFQVFFSRHYAVLEVVRGIPGRKFVDSPAHWLIPAGIESMAKLMKLAIDFDFEVPDNFFDHIAEITEEADKAITASRAQDADVVLPDWFGGGQYALYPYQRAGVAFGLNRQSVLIGDQPGVGKTSQALALLAATKSLPAVIVCPASLQLNWAKEIGMWMPSATVSILKGRSSEVPSYAAHVMGREIPINDFGADIVIVNYSIVANHVKMLKERANAAVICDESHYLSNGKAQRTKAVKSLASDAARRIFLTGTPIKNRPKELVSQLDILGCLDQFGGKWQFLLNYCGGVKGDFGWTFDGATNTEELQQKLRATCMIRRLKKDVLSELPDKVRSVMPVEISNWKEYKKASNRTVEYIIEKAKSDPELLEELRSALDLDDDSDVAYELERRAKAKGSAAERAIHLVRLTLLRQLASQGKISAIVEWAKDLIENGEKLVLFAVYKSVQDALLKAFPGAAHVLGNDSMQSRQDNVDRFQNDDDCRIIICSLAAAAEGITLTAASNVAFAGLGWHAAAHIQAEDRVHRVGQNSESVTATYFLGQDTVDEDMYAMIQRKGKVVEAVADGDPNATRMTSIVADLLKEVAA